MHFGVQSHARKRKVETAHHYVCQTKPNSEKYATDFLVNDKFEVYYPRVAVRSVRMGRVVQSASPLFARYIFIRDDGRGPFYFRNAPGISCIVRSGGDAVRIGQSVIDKIKLREGPDGLVQLDEEQTQAFHPTEFHHGEEVRLGYGRLCGFNAIFDKKLAHQRAAVLVWLMGRLSRTIVEFSDLEKL